MGPGGFCGLQLRCLDGFPLRGGFDSLALPPVCSGSRIWRRMKPLNELGQKISIIGTSNSGKSTLAQYLAKKLKVPCYHLDQLAFHSNTNWVRRPSEEFIQDHNKLLSGESWIIEGNYSSCMKERFDKSDSVIWLDSSVISCVYRYVARAIKNDSSRPGRLDGATKEFNFDMITHILFTYPKLRKRYSGLLSSSNVSPLIISSMKNLNKYYKDWELD